MKAQQYSLYMNTHIYTHLAQKLQILAPSKRNSHAHILHALLDPKRCLNE